MPRAERNQIQNDLFGRPRFIVVSDLGTESDPYRTYSGAMQTVMDYQYKCRVYFLNEDGTREDFTEFFITGKE